MSLCQILWLLFLAPILVVLGVVTVVVVGIVVAWVWLSIEAFTDSRKG